MAPRSFPDEIDVFTVPHSRMKELVNIYTQKVQCIDFRDGREVTSLLHDLDTTLYEFKSHESIENIFIMDQLKNRLKQRQIHNSAVCDCHNDNRLADVLQLVRTGSKVREQGVGERLSFCQELQRAFDEFVKNFLSHMEEEEQVFQPLLVEYFEYDELKVLKDIVLREHEHVKERHNLEKANDEEPETCDVVKELRDLDWDLGFFSDESQEEEGGYCSQFRAEPAAEFMPRQVDECLQGPLSTESSLLPSEAAEAPHLPTEILFKIFKQLSPQDLGRCAQVCTSWNDAAFSPALWKAIYPVQWARGIWQWHDAGLCRALEDAAQKSASSIYEWDEDKDIDESESEIDYVAEREHTLMFELVHFVLPRVGHGVGTLVVDAGRGITSRLLHDAIILCPNITVLSAAHTHVDYYLFKGLWQQGALQKLQRLDLQGCESIDDSALECLAQCASPNNPNLSSENSYAYCEDIPVSCPKGYPLDGSWKPIIQYCGHCTCWRANYIGQTSRSSYLTSCQITQNNPLSQRKSSVFNRPRDVRRADLSYNSHHSRQEHHHSDTSPYPRNTYDREVLNPERDIEEICCRPRSSPAADSNSQRNSFCVKLTIEEDLENYGYERVHNVSHVESFDNIIYGKFQLSYLNLSGCWRVTDEGLLALVEAKAVDRLCHLDVSGCFQLSGVGLQMFTCDSSSLKAENLFYCDNIVDGPYPTQANGCANLCNPVRVCCRSGRMN